MMWLKALAKIAFYNTSTTIVVLYWEYIEDIHFQIPQISGQLLYKFHLKKLFKYKKMAKIVLVQNM